MVRSKIIVKSKQTIQLFFCAQYIAQQDDLLGNWVSPTQPPSSGSRRSTKRICQVSGNMVWYATIGQSICIISKIAIGGSPRMGRAGWVWPAVVLSTTTALIYSYRFHFYKYIEFFEFFSDNDK
jgi:hypothetical protein